MTVRRALAIGGVLLLLGGAALGVNAVQAQTTPTPSAPPQQNLRERYEQALANRLHVTVDQLRQAIQDARNDVGLGGPGPGRAGGGERHVPPGFGFGRGGLPGFLGQQADALVSLFKLQDRQALRQELSGKTLAEVSAAHGVSVQDVVSTLTTIGNEQIDRMAQARGLSAERVAELKQRMSERVQEFVSNYRFPARGTGTRL